jgi:hypothetical protein
MKKLLATVGIVLALGIGAYGLSTVLPAGAQSTSLGAAAGPGARGEKVKAVLDKLVADGTISQDQEDKIIAALKEAAPAGGPRAGLRHRILHNAIEITAKTLDMSVGDLRSALASGKTVADVAAEKGVSLDTITQALTDAANAKLDEAVASGMISQERADTLKAKLPDAIDRFEHATFPMGGPKGHHGPLGPDDSTESGSTSS